MNRFWRAWLRPNFYKEYFYGFETDLIVKVKNVKDRKKNSLGKCYLHNMSLKGNKKFMV